MSPAPLATVSGPGGVDRPAETPAIGLSAAITYATQHGGPCTFYVRDHTGTAYGRVERDPSGVLMIYGPDYLEAEKKQRAAFIPTA